MIITTKGADISLKNIMKDLNNMVDSTLEDKFDVRKEVSPLVTNMDVNDCENTLYFEQTKRQQRLWITDSNFTLRLKVLNYASVYDLSSVYNYHKNSGHILAFSEDFDKDLNLKIFKTTAESTFKCKENASVERAICFFYIQGIICMRVYLIKDCSEIGPRIDIELDRIFEGCFKGKRIFTKTEEADQISQE